MKYYYIAHDDDFMYDSNGSRIIDQLKEGRRYKYSDVLKMENDYVYIRRPIDTNGWANFYNLIPGVEDPIKADEFPMDWRFEDEDSRQFIRFTRMKDPDKILVYHLSYDKADSNKPATVKMAYIGNIDGYWVALRQKMDHKAGDTGYSIMRGVKEIRFIHGPNIYGDGCKLIFEDNAFTPVNK